MNTHARMVAIALASCLGLSGCSHGGADADAPQSGAHTATDALPAGALPEGELSVAALSVEQAWIRSAPPGAAVLAGYATLRNAGGTPASVTPCATVGFGEVSLHETTHADGMARMRPVPELLVPAGGTVALAPGGMHLMLMQPRAIPAEGAMVPVCLSVDGTPRQVAFEVRRSAAAADPHAHRH